MTESKRRKKDSSWRSIVQTGFRPSGSKAGEKRQYRRLKRTLFIGGVYLLIIGISISAYIFFQGQELEKKISQPITFLEIKFESNGVLKKEIIDEYLGGITGKEIIDVDIFHIKTLLEELPQVKAALVERVFPGTLKISIDEYQAVAKVGIQENKKKKILHVSPEGVLFTLLEDTNEEYFHLPFLGGIKVLKDESGYLPIGGMGEIAPVLENARRNKPHLYNDWKIVSLGEKYLIDDKTCNTLKVNTNKLGMITFNLNKINNQLEKLDYILHDVETRKLGPVKEIDMSLGDQVTVQLMDRKYQHAF